MSEIQLQQLLQRTSSSNEKEGEMDMTVKDGVRMSKFDIRAIKIGSNVSAQMKTDVNNFNSKYVGKDSVFPLKNGAPRKLKQFENTPTHWSYEMSSPRATNPKSSLL
jgi:hypothetical protein